MPMRRRDLIMEWLMPNVALRYFPVVALLRATRAGSVLDVGCGDGGLGMFGWGRPFVGCDLHFYRPLPPMLAVVGAGGALPFADGAFDVVISLDTLEHVAPASRSGFIADLARVARRYLILAMPCGPVAERVERALDGWYALRGITTPPWLEEHVALRLPRRGEVEAAVAALGRPYQVYGNENALVHLLVMAAESSRRLRPLLVAFVRDRMDTAARIAGWLNVRPTYRQLFVVDLAGRQVAA
jgi:SAM-dependent methyltransferase